jgi:KaiC/GvpD/RAD55 family RecA-like ATPase
MPTVVAFSKGNLLAVAQLMQERHPMAQITVCADNDRLSAVNGGVETAMAVARAIGGLVAIPVFQTQDGKDFDDLRTLEGIEAVRQQIPTSHMPSSIPDKETLPTTRPPVLKYRLMKAAELRGLGSMQWLVKGIFPAEGIAAIYGPSASGKSFLAIDAAAAIAGDAERWFGRRVRHAPVTFIALEGEQGVAKRTQAWEEYHGKVIPDGLHFITQSVNLRKINDVNDLAIAVTTIAGHGGVVIIDTLNRAAVGADENSSLHMGEMIEGAKHLQRQIGGLVLLVHHTGKEVQRGLRGHSSLHAALDGAIEVKRGSGSARSWSVAKSKDDADGQECGFQLEIVHIGLDEYGEPVTSCVIAPDDRLPDQPSPKKPTGKNQRTVMNALANSLAAGSIKIDQAVELAAQKLDCAPNKKRYNAQEVIDKLVEAGIYKVQDDWLSAA